MSTKSIWNVKSNTLNTIVVAVQEVVNVQRQNGLRVYDILLPPKSPQGLMHMSYICLFQMSGLNKLRSYNYHQCSNLGR